MRPVSLLESVHRLIRMCYSTYTGYTYTVGMLDKWISKRSIFAQRVVRISCILAFSHYLLLKRFFSSTQVSSFTYTGLS